MYSTGGKDEKANLTDDIVIDLKDKPRRGLNVPSKCMLNLKHAMSLLVNLQSSSHNAHSMEEWNKLTVQRRSQQQQQQQQQPAAGSGGPQASFTEEHDASSDCGPFQDRWSLLGLHGIQMPLIQEEAVEGGSKNKEPRGIIEGSG